MWKTITPAEMKRIEGSAMARGLCSGEALMQRAAAAVARAAQAHWQQRSGLVVALCGTGNNGGDAVAALRVLTADDCVQGVCWMLPGDLSPDARRELDRLMNERPRVAGVQLNESGVPPLPEGPVACIIDGLFGTGLTRPLTGAAAALCQWCNQAHEQGVPVVAVDIPSGLNGETGRVDGPAICATETVTFHRPKTGLFLGQGLKRGGRVTVADIGLLPAWDDADGLAVAEGWEIESLLPRRDRLGHKGTFGRVLLFCGSAGMAGAAAIAATAALRSGAGLVTVACPERILDTVQMLCPCATCLPLPPDVEAAWALLESRLPPCDALGLGCGLGQSEWARTLVERILGWLSTHNLPAVIDADALNLLAGMNLSGIDLSRCVLTPHPGEAARLLDLSVAEITADAVSAARQLQARYGADGVLKGAASVLCTRQGMALNVLGTSAMGKGGSGDALTGILCAVLAARLPEEEQPNQLKLLQAATGLHGLAGLAAEKRLGSRGVLATDLCSCLGFAAAEAAGDRPRLPAPTVPDATESPSTSHRNPAAALGRTVTVTVDRKLGTQHPEHKDITYTLNYGYVQDVLADDNEWQDAYIYGETLPLEVYEGQVVAVIHRLDDVEDKWVVADPGVRLTREQVWEATRFVEKYFTSEIICL